MDILRRSACFKLNKLATKLGHHQQKKKEQKWKLLRFSKF